MSDLTFALYSDLHTEFDDRQHSGKAKKVWIPVNPEAKIFLFAGDNATTPNSLRDFAEKVEAENPEAEEFLYCAGNHEFYGNKSKRGERGYEKFREAINSLPRSTFLESEAHTLRDGTVVIGATMWTDLSHPDAESYARSNMNDYKNIRISEAPYRKIYPSDTTILFKKTIDFFKKCMDQYDPEKTIVMTHHSPTQYGMTREENEPIVLMDMYGARLDQLISMWQPALWVHGHTHHSIDRMIGDTRIFNNPRGYNIKDLENPENNYLNKDFNPELVFTLGREKTQGHGR